MIISLLAWGDSCRIYTSFMGFCDIFRFQQKLSAPTKRWNKSNFRANNLVVLGHWGFRNLQLAAAPCHSNIVPQRMNRTMWRSHARLWRRKMVHADAECLVFAGIQNESFLSEKTDWLPEWMVQNTKRPTRFVVGLVPQFWSHGYMILSSRWFKCNRLDPRSMRKTSLILAI